MSTKQEIEEGLNFTPRYNADGLLPCVTTCAKSGDVLMVAYMNEEAILKSIQTGEAHYWSRSRQELWHKGATSGYSQKIIEMRTDCDQDCIWIKVNVTPPTGSNKKDTACHTGRKSCFYRALEVNPKATLESKMTFIDDERFFDPNDVYNS